MFIQRGHQVHFCSAAQKTPHSTDLSSLGVTAHQVLLNHDSFDQKVSELAPEIVVFDRFLAEEQFSWRVAQSAPNALRILDAEDLHCLRDARHRANKQGQDINQSDVSLEQLHSDMALREIASIYRCDMSVFLSDAEIEILHHKFNVPRALLFDFPFILNDEVNCMAKTFSDRQHFVSIGNFRHAPNWDAVLRLRNTYWPLIRKALPQAEMHIYGAYLPPKAKALENRQLGFLVKGFADDAHQVIAEARVLLAPIAFGAGIKGKLVDAMRCGTPSVTTNIGAEGIASAEQWPGCVANDVDAFVQAAVSLYSNEKVWQQAAQQIPAILSNKFNPVRIADDLYQAIMHKKNKLCATRLDNFTGQMLMHHSMASSKYMSQWIEAKNK